MLATLGSGRSEEDVEYHSNEDNYDKARGKLERLCIVDALEYYFKKDESRQVKGTNFDGPVKDFESLWKELEWYRGDLSDWLKGQSRLECDEDVYCNPEAYDGKYADEKKYKRPGWIDNADNWPALTIDSFIYFLDVDRKCVSDGGSLVGEKDFANSILNKIKGRGVELGEEPDTLINGFDSHVMQICESDIDGRHYVSQQIPDTDILDTDINQTINQLKLENNNSNKLSIKYFVARVCNDDDVSKMLFRVLHETILPKISTKQRHTSYSWGHLYHTLFGLDLIVYCKRDKEKAKALQSIYGNKVTLDTIHGQIKNRKFPDGKYMEWGEQDPDRLICQEMAKWLQPVVDNIIPKSVSTDPYTDMEIW